MAGKETCALPGQKGSWMQHIKDTGSPATLKMGGHSKKATAMPKDGSNASGKSNPSGMKGGY